MLLRERFGWLVAPCSTVVHPSFVHTGLTDDPGEELERLLITMVLPPDPLSGAEDKPKTLGVNYLYGI